MVTIQPLVSVFHYILGLWILVSVLDPGPNLIKKLAPQIVAIYTIMMLLKHYPTTKSSIITILGWFS